MNSPKTISDGTITVTVHSANGIMGMRRHRLRYEQSKIEDTDQDSRLLRLTSYPDLVACTTLPMEFDEFAALPDAFLLEWEAAARELNPHWFDVGAGEKKATT